MPDFYERNMAIFKQHYAPFAKELDKVQINHEDFQIEEAATGDPTLTYKGIYLHSKRDPKREAERLAGADLEGQEAPALVLGFGLGYAAEALAARFPGRPIIIVEKRLDILKKALYIRNFSELLSKNRLAFVLDIESVIGALSIFNTISSDTTYSADNAISGVHNTICGIIPPLLIYNRALANLDKEWYSLIEERIGAWYTQSTVNQATKKRFNQRWEKNLSKNLEIIRDIPGITRLEGILKKGNIPVFIAAAGPSLDKTGPYLTEIHKRCLIIAMDTSLRFLAASGIEADFVVSVDAQYWNFRHLDRVQGKKVRLLTESAVYPSLFRHSFGSRFLCSSSFPPGRALEDKIDPKGELGAGGSVATSAWDFARHLGAANIWIAGLDLSFPDYKTHFRGALFEEKSHAESCRFSPSESWNFRCLLDAFPFWAEKAGGGKVLTDKRLSLYAAWFENRFTQFPGLKNYNLEGAGLEIKGLKLANKADLLALQECRKEINGLLAEFDQKITRDFSSAEQKEIRSKKFENAKASLQFAKVAES